MSCTDGSECYEGKIIFIGTDDMPSGREHFMEWYLKEHPELIDSELERLTKNQIDETDKKYLEMLKKLKKSF